MSQARTDMRTKDLLPGRGRGLPRCGAATALLVLAACMPTGPEARRASYLDCARDQGVTVREGTIITESADDLARLDACKAAPR